MDRCILQPYQKDSRYIQQAAEYSPSQTVAVVGREVAGKTYGEVQEQRRLQRPCGDVSPVDDPVERVQFRGVFERIKYKRDQTEDVEVRRFRRGPASEQHVDPDAQIDQGNEPQALIDRP